ncbi:MAG: putative Ig protein [Thermomicrobiales bacterium]|nr:putative Ig protein [Thermomicrobiales bacterium]
MASQGPLYPATISNVSSGSEVNEAWVNPTNIGADDGSNASVTAATFDTTDITHRLWGRAFGFSVPTDATIDGITVEVERHCAAGSAVDFRVQLTNAVGSGLGTSKADTVTAWPGSATVKTYGGATDLWGATPTPADINSGGFGLMMSAQATGNNTDVHIDFVRITVHYTEAAGTDRKAQVTWAEMEVPTAPRKAQVTWAEMEVPNAPRRAQVSWAEMEVPTAPRRAVISWAEMEVPDAPPGPRRAQVTWAEMEVPSAPRRALISWAEMEVPATPRRAQVTWAELEVPTAPRRAQVSWAEMEAPTAPRRAIVSWAEMEVPNEPGASDRRAIITWAEMEVPGGNIYYVKNGGSDAADGLSDDTAWATISKVNATATTGDTVRFKRGGVYRTTTITPAASGITYEDYGSGAKPRIVASELASGWTLSSGNQWYFSLATDPNVIWIDGVRGTEAASLVAMDAAGEWFFDSGASRLYVYSTTDPDSAFTSPGVEYAVRDSAITTNSKANTQCRRLEFGQGRGGVSQSGTVYNTFNSTGSEFLDCDVKGAYAHGVITNGATSTGFRWEGTTRADSIIEDCGDCGITNNHNNTTIARIGTCTLRRNGWRVSSGSGIIARLIAGQIDDIESYENGTGSSGTGTRHGIYIANGNSPASPADVLVFNIWSHGQPNGSGFTVKSSCTISDVLSEGNSHDGFTTGENNTACEIIVDEARFINNATYGIRQNIVPSAALTLRFYHTTAAGNGNRQIQIDDDLTEIDVRNCIFDPPSTDTATIPVDLATQTGTVVWDYNLTHRPSGSSSSGYRYGGVSKDFTAWQALGFDAHGLFGVGATNDPAFTDLAGGDVTLQTTSPAIDVGVAISGINDGYEGSAPDLGAFETSATTSRRAIVAWAELEVPNAPRRAIVAWAELEVPNAPRRAVVAWAELEVPTAPRRAIVAWAELEVPDAPVDDNRRAIITWAELEVPRRRGRGGFKRILYDPAGAQEEIDEVVKWSPDDAVLEASPLPEPGPLPEPRNTESTTPVRLPKKRQIEATIEIVDDEDEIDFILNIVLDLD